MQSQLTTRARTACRLLVRLKSDSENDQECEEEHE